MYTIFFYVILFVFLSGKLNHNEVIYRYCIYFLYTGIIHCSMSDETNKSQNKEQIPYKIEDAMKVTDDIFKLSKDKDYNPGAFIHGLVFALEYAQHLYKVPQQQIATIKRDCRKYFQEIDNFHESKT